MRIRFTIVFCFLFSVKGISQCCSPGNPVGGDANQGVLNKNIFRAIGIFKNSVSNDYYEGDKKSGAPSFVDKGSFNFSGIALAYGLHNRLTLESELGYFLSKKQEYNTITGKQVMVGKGLSDLALIGKYKLISKPHDQFELTVGGGYKIPVGQYQQRNQSGILLPIDIQPSSGAYGFLGTLFLYKGYAEKKLRFCLTSRMQVITQDVVFNEIIPAKYYRFGDFYTTSFFAFYGLSHRWSMVLQARHEYRTRDIYKFSGDAEYRVYGSSGGQKVLIIPQVVFEVRQGLNASMMFDIPVYQYYNQKQLATAYAGTITLSKTFDFSRSVKKTADDENREN